MQATMTRKNRGFNQLTLSLLAAALLAATIAGVLAYTLNMDSSDNAAPRISAPATTQMPSWRFGELNQLPVASVQPVQREAGWRFAEMNQLPITPAIAPAGFERQHFIEINQMPGESVRLVAPEITRGTRS
jgi:hypothetical protein